MGNSALGRFLFVQYIFVRFVFGATPTTAMTADIKRAVVAGNRAKAGSHP